MLVIKRITQAGDCFLLTFNCPSCDKEQFEGFPLKDCSHCRINLSEYELYLPQKSQYRLLSGTKRKKGRISKKLIQNLINLQGFNCFYCLKSFSELAYEVEHIIPISFGGTNLIQNLCLSCKKCNLIAGSKVFNTIQAKVNYIRSKK